MSDPIEIKTLQPIKVSGLSNKVRIVGADYQVGDLKKSSRVTVSMIDPDKVLEEFPLSVSQPVKIEIGSLTFLGYPISESRKCSPSGDNVISVSFVDGSFILDKILVGLWGKHYQATPKQITVGDATFKNWSRGSFYGSDPFIIVGDFVDPCGDDQLNVKVDPCDPCRTTPLELIQEYEEEMRKVDCTKLRDLSILDVTYSFEDLITAINNGWPPVRINSTPFIQGVSTYKRDYTGTLREVLNDWCRDFGWTYYWEAGQIVFIDLRAGIDINLKGLTDSCDILSIDTSRSMEGTYSNNVIGYFGREGQERDYQCNYEFGKRIVCRSLTLKDLISPTQPMAKFASAYTGVNGINPNDWTTDKYDLVELLCMASLYSPRLREAIVWLNVYGVVSDTAAQERVETSKSITGIAGVTIPYTCYHDLELTDDVDQMRHSLPLLDMTIKKVFSKTLTPTAFTVITEAVGGEIKELIDAQEDDEDEYYFFFGSRNEEKFSTRYEWESSIGSDYLGKFFIRKFDSILGGAPNVTAAGGDTAKYFEHKEIGLDFSKFFTTQNPESYVSELTNSEGEARDAFILVERTPMWLPTPNEGDSLEQLINICDEIIPQEVTAVLSIPLDEGVLSSADFRNDHEDADTTKNGGWTDVDTLFFVKKYKASKNSGSLTISNLTTYDFHPKDTIKEVEIEGYETPVKVGLRSVQAKKIAIENIIFWMPPQATVREQEVSPTTEHIPYAGGYYVMVNNNASKETLLIVPKIEIVRRFSHSYAGDTLTSNLVGASLNDNTLEEYYYDEVELGCIPKIGTIEEALDDYVSPLKINQTKLLYETTIEINGVPAEEFSVSDGFKSISIRYYGDGGPISTLIFGNSLPVPEDINTRLEMRKNLPTFFSESSKRRWGRIPSNFPRETGYPTL